MPAEKLETGKGQGAAAARGGFVPRMRITANPSAIRPTVARYGLARVRLTLLAGDQDVPDGQQGLVEVVDRLLAERRDLVRVPVALEVRPVLPEPGLAEVEGILDVPGQGPALGAERHRTGGTGFPDLVPALGAERVDVPVDVDDVERPAPRGRLLPRP